MTTDIQQSIREGLQRLESAGQRRQPRQVDSRPGGRCVIEGRELVNFGSNDYLGLAHHPQVCAAFGKAAESQAGATASSLIVGRSGLHAELERRLAQFEGAEAALLFPTGFAANAGTIQALATAADVIFSESENHASLIDGCRGARAAVRVFCRHDLSAFRSMLQAERGRFQHALLITDAVFSMDGTVAPLRELCELADEFQLTVIVDEAHGTGVLGTQGRGASELLDVEHSVFLRVGTLSKAIGSLGGFVVGTHETIEWLRNRARPQFFSTAAPPAVCAAALASLDLVEAEPRRRLLLAERNREAREYAVSVGLRVVGDGPAPIIAVLPDGGPRVAEVSRRLQQAGWFVPAILPPTVAAGTSRLRISLTADHPAEDIRAMLDAIQQLSSAE